VDGGSAGRTCNTTSSRERWLRILHSVLSSITLSGEQPSFEATPLLTGEIFIGKIAADKTG
jgi:hypothetical protein